MNTLNEQDKRNSVTTLELKGEDLFFKMFLVDSSWDLIKMPGARWINVEKFLMWLTFGNFNDREEPMFEYYLR